MLDNTEEITEADMRKAICFLFTVVIILTSTGCISWPDSNTVEITTNVPIDIDNPPLPNPDELQFFKTIEEAVEYYSLENFNRNYTGDKIIVFENDEYAVLFYRENLDDGDVVYAMKFMVKEIDGTAHYSTPFNISGVFWEHQRLFVKRGRLDEIGEIRFGISQDTLRLFRVDGTKNFFWGLSQTERVKNLRIEGQLVTKVIEIELDGEIAYFWYFEDLQTDKKPVFKDLRKYTEGEFIITMDE